eukprot:PITA_00777
MNRRCSHCGHNGHNSRTCPDRGVKLFGVRLTTDEPMRKSLSMGNLPLTPEQSESGAAEDGYVSDGLVQNSRERKKGFSGILFRLSGISVGIDLTILRQYLIYICVFTGVPWTEEEHKMFLLGLHKLGKGDWRGISRNFVTSRTPTQVASHAQKYFLRQSNLNKRKRRSSLFDISTDSMEDCYQGIPELSPVMHDLSLGQNSSLTSGNFFETGGAPPNLAASVGAFSVPPLAASRPVIPPCLSLGMYRLDKSDDGERARYEAKYSSLNEAERQESGGYSNPTSHYSFTLPFWPDLATKASKIIKPSAPTSPSMEARESIENSGLSLSIAPPSVDPPAPHNTVNLDQSNSRRSAFRSSNLDSSSNAISVV